MEEVGHVPLILQQPVDRRLPAHRLAERLRRRLPVRFEQPFVIDLVGVQHARVEPHRHDDPQVVRFLLRDIAGPHRVEYPVRDPRLHRTHQDIRVLLAVDGHLADHQRRRPDLHVAVEDREHARVTFGLIADEIGDREADRTVQFADDDFRFGREIRRAALRFIQGFAGPQHDASEFRLLRFEGFFLGHFDL